ncbi:inositol monophosphatase family protein [Streptomyces sp. TRM43335]|uniref:Inositol monophosphatase family protein n=1 Tax=Streptomyces taklimakanensis TaxID=2569853 RepID=A0A6G2BGU2_9ACTN|nr:inositol monophosphatase [Streptomyces taklimakanensis]MTE21424.1 inositol monophosphatase family protein [Streptomyces taklimakanensis]
MRTGGSVVEPGREPFAVAGKAVDAGVEWLARAGREWSERRFKESGEEVTDADGEVERRVTRVLRQHFPDIPVVGEESDGAAGDGGPLPSRCWLLDPIDGTMNFTRGAPLYAVSLALVEDGRPSLGVLHAPALDRRWNAAPAGPGGSKPPVEPPGGARALSRAVIGVTGAGSSTSRSGRYLDRLLDGAYRVRMHGCMSMDLVGVAEGWLDGCVCLTPKPWDVAAGVALLRRRGRAVLGAGGREFAFDSPLLAAGPAPLARELAALWDSTAAGRGAGRPS